MKDLWSWLTKEREFPGPLRYIDIFKLRRLVTIKRIIIVVCAVVGLHTVLNIWAYQVLQGELKKAQAVGIEMDLRKLEQARISEGENAANLYRAAFALLRSCQGEHIQVTHAMEDYWPEQGGPGPEVTEAFRQFLELHRVALALSLIQEANTMPECNWGLRYEDTFQMLLPHLSGARNAAKALLVRARLRHVTGDPSGALADVQAVVRLAERIESDRLVISELVQYAVLDLWVTAVRQMNTAQRLDADTATQLCDCLARWEGLIGTTEALEVETAGAYFWSEQARQDAKTLAGLLTPRVWTWTARIMVSYPYRPIYRLDQARLLRYELELVDLSRKPYYMVQDRLNEFDAEIRSHSKVFFLTRRLVPVLPRLQMVVTKARAQARTTQLGLALEAHREGTGSYPDSIEALVPDILPELPVDPFTGKNFLYRLTDEELVVYSAAKNGMDDGGLKEEVGERGVLLNPGADDIAWRIPR